jgi:hypothetical protein
MGVSCKLATFLQLCTFTPLIYVSSKGSKGVNQQRPPVIVIHVYSKIGYAPLPCPLNNPMTCVNAALSQQRDVVPRGTTPISMKEYDKLVAIECTPHQQYCARYGLSLVLCICKTDPPDKINLEVLREFSWFATKEVTDMDNSNKWNMLYWWYMTNMYNIGGKGVTKEPPTCPMAAI